MSQPVSSAAEQLATALLSEIEDPCGRPGVVVALQRLLDRGLWHPGPGPGSTEADALWGALDVAEGHRVVEAVLIGKIVNFASEEQRPPSMSMATTDGMDWVQQYGMLHGALALQNALPWQNTSEESPE